MLSRVLKPDQSSPVEPMAWLQLGADSGDAGSQCRPADDQARMLQAQVAQLEGELESREQQAYRKGLEQGEAASQERASANVQPLLERFGRTFQELSEYRHTLRRQAEDDVVKLALAIARRILHRELSVDPEALLGLVKAALERIESREIERIRVNPRDAAMLDSYFQRLGFPTRVQVLGDPALERGAAVFETSRGELEASVASQLEEIHRGLCDRSRR